MGGFWQEDLPFLKTFLPPIHLPLYPLRGCREVRGDGQVITLFSTFLQLRKKKEKEKRQDKPPHAAVVSGQQILSYLLFKKKNSPQS